MKVIEDKQNELLNRREVKIIVEAEKNPSFSESLKLVGETFKSQEDLIEVKEIKGKFGRSTFLISAFIYKTKEEKERSEKKKEKKSENKPQEQAK